MKILFLNDVLKRGGSEQAMLNLLPALRARGHEVAVAALYPPYDEAEIASFEAAGLTVYRLNIRRARDIVGSVRALSRLCREWQADVLHSNLIMSNVLSALLRRGQGAGGKKLVRVATFHNVDYERWEKPGQKPNIRKRARKSLHGWLMRRLEGHSGVSRAVSEHYAHHLHLRDVRTILNALPVEAIVPDAHLDADAVRAEYGLAADDFVFIMPARLAPAKGHIYALLAMARLSDEMSETVRILPATGLPPGEAVVPGAGYWPERDAATPPPLTFSESEVEAYRSRPPRLLIVGSGDLEVEIKAQVGLLHLGERVVFLPAMPHEKLFPLMQSSDVFLMPSLQEGMPMALAEAMLLERACLCSDIPALRDLALPNETARVEPAGDSTGLTLAQAMLHLHDATLRQRLGQNARRHVAKVCASDEIARQWDEFYGELRERHGS